MSLTANISSAEFVERRIGLGRMTEADRIARRAGIGASEAAAAVGLAPWEEATPYQLYLEKIGEAPPPNPKREHALRFQMGHALEPVALFQFCEQTHLQISDRQRKFVDPSWSRRWATVDALASDGGVVNAKSVGFADPDEWGDENDDSAVPMAYLLQSQHEMACTGRAHAWIPLIVSNRQFRVYRVRRDDDLIELLTEKEREFWAHVEARDPPPPINLDDVKLRWPSHSGASIHATAEVAQAVAEHVALKAQIKALDVAKDACELLIKTHMGAASELLDSTGVTLATWRQSKSSYPFNAKRFALERPDLYRQYLDERPGARPFLSK